MKKLYFIVYTFLFIFACSFLIYIYNFDIRNNTRQFYSSEDTIIWTEYSQQYADNTMIIKGTIPAQPNVCDLLVFYSVHQNITVYCDEKVIYQFPVENNNPFAKTPGYNWNFVTLPNRNNEITIQITSPYAGYTEDIPTFYVGNTVSIIGKIISSNIISFVLCIIIFCFGICMVVYWIYIRFHMPIKLNLLNLGVFALFLSFWSANESRFTTLIFGNNLVCSYIAFISLMMLPLPFALFVRSYYGDDSDIWDIFCFLDVIQIITCLALQLLKVADLRNTLWTTHIMMLFLALIVLTSSKKLLKKKEKSKQISLHLFCICICTITLILDIFAFYLGSSDSNTFGRIGFLLYIIILGISSIRDSASLMKLGKKATTYQQLAFTDQMTKLSNRTAFNRDFTILSSSPNDIAVIGFDLNCLKQINDTLGHTLGDDYIINSAKIISNTYSNVGKCYRVGGDEFVVIIEQASHFDFQYYFNLLEWSVDSFNAGQKNIHMQIAYGYAIYDSALDKSLEDTYNRADKNMYMNKKNKKRSRS